MSAAARSCRWPAVCFIALALVAATAACSKRDDFPDRTAQVSVGGKITTFTIDSCGLDGRTLFVVGRSRAGEVLQEVVGLKADKETGVTRATGFTLIGGARDIAAFGSVSWAARDGDGPVPGKITSARLRGSRIQVGAIADPIDDQDRRTDGDPVDVYLDARCDQRDESS